MEQQFRIDRRHLALFKRMYVGWNGAEFGAPSIEPKRPYGNGDVIGDMRDILNLAAVRNEDGEFSESFNEAMTRLHESMKTALQICLALQKFETGLFKITEKYNRTSWVRVGA